MGAFLDSAEDIWQDKKSPPRQAHEAEEALEKKEEQGVKMIVSKLKGNVDMESLPTSIDIFARLVPEDGTIYGKLKPKVKKEWIKFYPVSLSDADVDKTAQRALRQGYVSYTGDLTDDTRITPANSKEQNG